MIEQNEFRGKFEILIKANIEKWLLAQKKSEQFP